MTENFFAYHFFSEALRTYKPGNEPFGRVPQPPAQLRRVEVGYFGTSTLVLVVVVVFEEDRFGEGHHAFEIPAFGRG